MILFCKYKNMFEIKFVYMNINIWISQSLVLNDSKKARFESFKACKLHYLVRSHINAVPSFYHSKCFVYAPSFMPIPYDFFQLEHFLFSVIQKILKWMTEMTIYIDFSLDSKTVPDSKHVLNTLSKLQPWTVNIKHLFHIILSLK